MRRIPKWILQDDRYGKLPVNYISPFKLTEYFFLARETKNIRRKPGWILTYTLLGKIHSFGDEYNFLVLLKVSGCCHRIHSVVTNILRPSSVFSSYYYSIVSFFRMIRIAVISRHGSRRTAASSLKRDIIAVLYDHKCYFLILNNKSV